MNTRRIGLLQLVILVLLSSVVAPVRSLAQTDVRVYALKDPGACSGASVCPVDLTTIALSGSADHDLGPLKTSGGDLVAMRSLALSPDNHLYGTDGADLYRIDDACARSLCTVVRVATVPVGKDDAIEALTFHPDGRLFAGTHAGLLLTINRSNGRITSRHNVGVARASLSGDFSKGFGFDGGLAFGRNGDLYATVVACPLCASSAASSPSHDGLAFMSPPSFSRPTLVTADTGFDLVRGLVFVAGDQPSAIPVLLGTTTAQPSGGPCSPTGALVRLDPAGGTGRLARCLSFSALSAAANPILPPLIASVTFRHVVHPGWRQIVRVRVSPDTVTRLRVTFPNGDRMARKAIADTTGRVLFRFPQKSSEITRTNAKARLRVLVGSGQTEASETYLYDITYGAIDAAVAPRAVQPGGRVTISVHTWPHRQVIAYLLFPNSRIVKLRGTTGAAGWASLHSRIARSAVSRAVRRVEVIALLAKGNPGTSTSTSFVVSKPGTRR